MPRIPLPSKFEDGDFASFRRLFERVAKANAWTEEQQLATLPLALGSRALLAFEREEAKIANIADAYKVLENEFGSALDREAAMKEFNSCQWGVGLDPDVYAAKLKQLLALGLPSLDNSDRDRILINQFINGFSGSHKEKLRLLFSGKSPSLTEVVAAAKDVVRGPDEGCRALEISEQISQSQISARLEAISDGLEALTTKVAAIEKRNGDTHKGGGSSLGVGRRGDRRDDDRRGRIQCFNCSGFGHMARSCPSPRYGRNKVSGNGPAGDRKPTAHPR